MQHGVTTALAVILSVNVWPPGRGLASIDRTSDVSVGVTDSSTTSTRGLLLFAKHRGGDSDDGYEESEHRYHQKDGQFCGPYFKSSSVLYFRDYYSRDNYVNLPPGLRKHLLKTGHLPPGLEKKYERTGQLPPGLQKRFECGQTLPAHYSPYLYPVPNVAYERVGPLPPDSKMYLYGNDLILLNDHTKAIVDILRGAY